MIHEAASCGANLVLLPEAMNLGWTHPSAKTMADSITDGDTCHSLIRSAKDNKVFICSGLVEKIDDKVFNSALIINNRGHSILKHHKINELNIGHDYYNQGNRLNIVHTDLGILGVMIFSDAFAKNQVLSRSLCYIGADIILLPCCWAVPPEYDNSKTPYDKTWKDAYIPVARDFSVWIASVSNVGSIKAGLWKGWKCIGGSFVIDPKGNEILQAPYGVEAEKICYVDIEIVQRTTRGTGWQEHWQTHSYHVNTTEKGGH